MRRRVITCSRIRAATSLGSVTFVEAAHTHNRSREVTTERTTKRRDGSQRRRIDRRYLTVPLRQRRLDRQQQQQRRRHRRRCGRRCGRTPAAGRCGCSLPCCDRVGYQVPRVHAACATDVMQCRTNTGTQQRRVHQCMAARWTDASHHTNLDPEQPPKASSDRFAMSNSFTRESSKTCHTAGPSMLATASQQATDGNSSRSTASTDTMDDNTDDRASAKMTKK